MQIEHEFPIFGIDCEVKRTFDKNRWHANSHSIKEIYFKSLPHGLKYSQNRDKESQKAKVQLPKINARNAHKTICNKSMIL